MLKFRRIIQIKKRGPYKNFSIILLKGEYNEN